MCFWRIWNGAATNGYCQHWLICWLFSEIIPWGNCFVYKVWKKWKWKAANLHNWEVGTTECLAFWMKKAEINYWSLVTIEALTHQKTKLWDSLKRVYFAANFSGPFPDITNSARRWQTWFNFHQAQNFPKLQFTRNKSVSFHNPQHIFQNTWKFQFVYLLYVWL